MESFEILTEASHFSKALGTFLFLISGIGVSLNYYYPSLLPEKAIIGMYYFLSIGFMGMTYFSIIYRNNPHISSEICPKCKSRVKYTGLKCSKSDCNYKVKFE